MLTSNYKSLGTDTIFRDLSRNQFIYSNSFSRTNKIKTAESLIRDIASLLSTIHSALLIDNGTIDNLVSNNNKSDDDDEINNYSVRKLIDYVNENYKLTYESFVREKTNNQMNANEPCFFQEFVNLIFDSTRHQLNHIKHLLKSKKIAYSNELADKVGEKFK